MINLKTGKIRKEVANGQKSWLFQKNCPQSSNRSVVVRVSSGDYPVLLLSPHQATQEWCSTSHYYSLRIKLRKNDALRVTLFASSMRKNDALPVSYPGLQRGLSRITLFASSIRKNDAPRVMPQCKVCHKLDFKLCQELPKKLCRNTRWSSCTRVFDQEAMTRRASFLRMLDANRVTRRASLLKLCPWCEESDS